MSKETVILIKISPKASKSEIVGWEGEELKIRLKAVPEKGKANKELIKFLSKELAITQKQIKIIFGDKSRHKKIMIIDLPDDSILGKKQ